MFDTFFPCIMITVDVYYGFVVQLLIPIMGLPSINTETFSTNVKHVFSTIIYRRRSDEPINSSYEIPYS